MGSLCCCSANINLVIEEDGTSQIPISYKISGDTLLIDLLHDHGFIDSEVGDWRLGYKFILNGKMVLVTAHLLDSKKRYVIHNKTGEPLLLHKFQRLWKHRPYALHLYVDSLV